MISRYRMSMANQIDISDWYQVETESLPIQEWVIRRIWIENNISGHWSFSSTYNWIIHFSNEEDSVFYKMVWS